MSDIILGHGTPIQPTKGFFTGGIIKDPREALADLPLKGETVVPASSLGQRFNAGKTRYDLIPPDALEKLAEVYTIGAQKYADRNWEKGFPWMSCYASLMRHVQAWAAGQDLDVGPNGEFGPYPDQPDINMKWTGLPHMALAAWNCMALTTFFLRDAGVDDRIKLI